MIQKKIYEEAQIEIIEFECKDVLTTSSLIDEEWEKEGQVNVGNGGETKGFKRNV